MPKCFVIMPFSPTASCQNWDEIYSEIIEPAVKQSKLKLEVSRSQIRNGAFIKDILLHLNEADVVIADLTDRNPNVFYELGVRHTLRNRTILISQKLEHVPSDLGAYGVITYGTSPSEVTKFKREMKKLLTTVMCDPDRPDNPVSDFLKNADLPISQFERRQSLRKTAALISELSYNLSTAARISKIVASRLDDSSHDKPLLSFQTAALIELIATNYVTLSEHYLLQVRSLLHSLTITNNQIDSWRNQVSYDKKSLEILQINLKVVARDLEATLKAIGTIHNQCGSSTFDENSLPLILLADDSHKDLVAAAQVENLNDGK